MAPHSLTHSLLHCDVKFMESHFPAKEKSLIQSGLAPLSDHKFPKESNEDLDSSDLDLVTLNQPQQGLPSPGLPAQVTLPPQPQIVPPTTPGG